MWWLTRLCLQSCWLQMLSEVKHCAGPWLQELVVSKQQLQLR